MRYVFVIALLAAGCSKEIGDECSTSSDCDPNGERFCDLSSPSGYCTVQGCDADPETGDDTCPDESVCVRFFTGSFANRSCNTAEPYPACSLDEVCSLSGTCVPRSSEIRYCMRKCSSQDDCRDGYECRDRTLMMERGGEPVGLENPNDGKFCASAKRS